MYFFWLCWVFMAFLELQQHRLLSNCGARASDGSGFSCPRAWPLQHEGFSACRSWGLEHRLSSRGSRLSCSKVCGIFLDQGSTLCLRHWQVDCLPLSHQGSPVISIFKSGNWGSEGHRDWHTVADLVLLPQGRDTHLLGMGFQPLSFPPRPCQR